MSNSNRYTHFKITGPLSVIPTTPEELKDEHLVVFILMGPTGAGKSAFIESLSSDAALSISKDSLESVTKDVVCYKVINLRHKSGPYTYLLMDTPGFLDTKLSESRITRSITDKLDALREFAEYEFVYILYFQPITDIRMGCSKRGAVKLSKVFAEAFGSSKITAVTTMWNRISTPKQAVEANKRFRTFEKEIFKKSGKLSVAVTKFDFTEHSALSLLDIYLYGWTHARGGSSSADPQYQSLVHTNLLERIANTIKELQLLVADRHYAATTELDNDLLLQIVQRNQKASLTALQSFVDDILDMGPTGLMTLQSLLDNLYEADPESCFSSIGVPSTTVSIAPQSLTADALAETTALLGVTASSSSPPAALEGSGTPSVSLLKRFIKRLKRLFERRHLKF